MRIGVSRFLGVAVVSAWCTIAPAGATAEGPPTGWLRLASAARDAAAAQASGRALTLAELVRLSLTRNADLGAARERVAEAEGQRRQAALGPIPNLSLDFDAGRPFGSRGEREFSIAYAHVFELGGKRDRRVDVADLALEAARFEIVHRARALVAAVETAFAEAIAARRNLDVAGRLLDLTRQSQRLVERRVALGDAPPLDERQLQVEVARLDSARVMFESRAERAVLQLKTLAGVDAAASLDLDPAPREPPPGPFPVEQAVALALEQRADLQEARVEEQMGAADVRLARAGAVPDLVGSIGFAQSTSRFDQFGVTSTGQLTELRDTDRMLIVGVTVGLPIVSRNQGNIQAARARADAARLRREYLEQAVRNDVRAALARYDAARRAADIFQEQATAQSERNLEVVRASYTLGETRLADVIVEQRRLIDVQQAYTDILLEEAAARADLARALGAATEVLP